MSQHSYQRPGRPDLKLVNRELRRSFERLRQDNLFEVNGIFESRSRSVDIEVFVAETLAALDGTSRMVVQITMANGEPAQAGERIVLASRDHLLLSASAYVLLAHDARVPLNGDVLAMFNRPWLDRATLNKTMTMLPRDGERLAAVFWKNLLRARHLLTGGPIFAEHFTPQDPANAKVSDDGSPIKSMRVLLFRKPVLLDSQLLAANPGLERAVIPESWRQNAAALGTPETIQILLEEAIADAGFAIEALVLGIDGESFINRRAVAELTATETGSNFRKWFSKELDLGACLPFLSSVTLDAAARAQTSIKLGSGNGARTTHDAAEPIPQLNALSVESEQNRPDSEVAVSSPPVLGEETARAPEVVAFSPSADDIETAPKSLRRIGPRSMALWLVQGIDGRGTSGTQMVQPGSILDESVFVGQVIRFDRTKADGFEIIAAHNDPTFRDLASAEKQPSRSLRTDVGVALTLTEAGLI